jgi:hypothetical protein
LPSIVIGDAHFGMRADSRETKEQDYDTKIAVYKYHLDAIDYLVDVATASEHCSISKCG